MTKALEITVDIETGRKIDMLEFVDRQVDYFIEFGSTVVNERIERIAIGMLKHNEFVGEFIKGNGTFGFWSDQGEQLSNDPNRWEEPDSLIEILETVDKYEMRYGFLGDPVRITKKSHRPFVIERTEDW